MAELVFRFRPYSILTLKELEYQELFLAYDSELNDPLDRTVDLMIPADRTEVLRSFLLWALRAHDRLKEDKPEYYEIATRTLELFRGRQLWLVDLLRIDYKEYFKAYYTTSLGPNRDFERYYECFRNIISNLFPKKTASLSFSTSPDNPVLWSVYANSHKGFCLMFEIEDNKMDLRRRNGRKYSSFELSDVGYDSQKTVDLSQWFTGDGLEEFDDNFDKFLADIRLKAMLTKYSSWQHEKEKRIVDESSITFSARKREESELSIGDRILHYKKDQLYGLILGLRMSEHDKREVKNAYLANFDKCRLYEAVVDNDKIGARMVMQRSRTVAE